MNMLCWLMTVSHLIRVLCFRIVRVTYCIMVVFTEIGTTNFFLF
jgi:hypothetical protein